MTYFDCPKHGPVESTQKEARSRAIAWAVQNGNPVAEQNIECGECATKFIANKRVAIGDPMAYRP